MVATLGKSFAVHVSYSVALATVLPAISTVNLAIAQTTIVPDSTLGSEPSLVTADDTSNWQISDGASRGSNLFHSFSDFSVGKGQSAIFVNPDGIDTIISRVTGGTASQILGRLAVAGPADLYLLNPAGIVFGDNAQLDVQGSFVATTADALELGEGNLFSATQATVPSQLLTVHPSAFLFEDLDTGSITSTSMANAGLAPNQDLSTAGLRVADDFSLILLGGDIILDGGGLYAFGGHIELGGARGPGAIQLNHDGQELSLAYPSSVQPADIDLQNNSEVVVAADGTGTVRATANTIRLAGESSILGGVLSNMHSTDDSSGVIEIQATDAIDVSDNSQLLNVVSVGTTGNSGGINIQTGSLTISDNATISTISSGQGNAGHISVLASDGVTLANGASIDASLQNNAVGTAGSIDLVSPQVTISSESENNRSSLISTVSPNAIGNSGDISLEADRIKLHRATVTTNNFGVGDAGKIAISASDSAAISGDSFLASSHSAQDENGKITFSTGNGGDITVLTGQFTLTDDSTIASAVIGSGTAGTIRMTIDDTISLSKASNLLSSSFGSGSGGNLLIQAKTIVVEGGSAITAASQGTGTAGDISIRASDTLSLSNTSNISASFLGLGTGGDISIKTGALNMGNGSTISSDNFDPESTLPILENSADESNSNLTLEILKSLDDSNSPQGDAGHIEIVARDAVSMFGQSALTSSVSGDASGGNIQISTPKLTLKQGLIFSNTTGAGNSGSIAILDSDLVSLWASQVTARSRDGSAGAGGSIRIETNELNLAGSVVSSSTSGSGIAGDIDIEADDSVILVGAIVQPQNHLENLAAVSPTASDADSAERSSSLLVNSISSIANSGGEDIPGNTGNAGALSINTDQLVIRNGSSVQVSTFGRGEAGSIRVRAGQIEIGDTPDYSGDFITGIYADTLNLSDNPTLSIGNGGNIGIVADSLSVGNGGGISAEARAQGNAGDVTIVLNDELTLTDGTVQTSATRSSGGDVTISADRIRLSGDGDIRTSVASDAGGGGNITLSAQSIVAFDDSDILAFSESGRGGNIVLTTPAFFRNNAGFDDAEASRITLDGNGRADVNASGSLANGSVIIPDVSFIQNDLSELPDTYLDKQDVLSNSCIAPRRKAGAESMAGRFNVTGPGGLTQRPDSQGNAVFPVGGIRTLPTEDAGSAAVNLSQASTGITEPQGIYHLDDGRLVLSRGC